jgi:hypothetical protein
MEVGDGHGGVRDEVKIAMGVGVRHDGVGGIRNDVEDVLEVGDELDGVRDAVENVLNAEDGVSDDKKPVADEVKRIDDTRSVFGDGDGDVEVVKVVADDDVRSKSA